MSTEQEHSEDHDINYVKIWAILMVLLGISVVGPMAEIRWLTLITAFGIALIKAYTVAAYFMHLKWEKHYISYALIACVAFLGLLFAGVSPDVLKSEGHNWVNVSGQPVGMPADHAATGH